MSNDGTESPRVCGLCYGDGEISDDNGEMIECPQCDGTGVEIID